MRAQIWLRPELDSVISVGRIHVNYRVGLFVRVPKRIGSANIQLTGGQPGLNRLRVVSQDYHCTDSRGVAKHERPHERRQ